MYGSIKYQLIDAKLMKEEYINLFQQYCAELLLEDATIAQYDPKELARENLTEETDHPYLITVNGELAGFVVFSDEAAPVGEKDCHTYINELFILESYRKSGLGSQVAIDYFETLQYDTGLCYIRGSIGEKFWLTLMKRHGYRYDIFKEDEIRDFIHIYLYEKKQD